MMYLKRKNLWVNIGAGISVFLIIYCIIYICNYYSANSILWNYPQNITVNEELKVRALSPSEIGDSIGGVLGPIIGLLASILTFLAFYMQKRANDEIQVQFKTQQFESQFYEMLRLHKENVNEMSLEFPVLGEDSENPQKISAEKRKVFEEMSNFFYRILQQSIMFGEISQQEYEAAYKLFFWGFNEHYYNLLNRRHSPISQPNNQTDDLLRLLSNHKGYASSLAHYFRHLFLIVKFVDRSSVVKDYEDKMRYLKILRAQLTNHEQIILFYNWLCKDYGSAWQESQEEGNKFFTDYKMIHNIWHKELYPHDFFYAKINALIDEYNQEPKSKPLFEFQGRNTNFKLELEQTAPLAERFE